MPKLRPNHILPLPAMRARNYHLLLASQFLSAFGDNALLWIFLGPLTRLQRVGEITEETLRLKSAALTAVLYVPFVLLGPFVGYLNDRFAKSHWLAGGNLIKLFGTAIAMLSLTGGRAWETIGYFIVGIGSCAYSPAKYGILPEILPRERLVKANGSVEMLTLIAILTGMIAGAWMVDQLSPLRCYLIVIGVYGLSLLLNLFMDRTPSNPAIRLRASVGEFFAHTRGLFGAPRLARILVGIGVFWAFGVTLKVNFQAWGLEVLELESNTQIALLGLWLSLGVMAGSMISGQLYRVSDLRAVRRNGVLLTAAVMALGLVEILAPASLSRMTVPVFGSLIWPVVVVLVAAGTAAGLYLIPLNAALQAESDPRKLGKTIAVQNVVDNSAMIAATALILAGVHFDYSPSKIFLGLAALIGGTLLWLRIPEPATSPRTDC
ncbi:MAG: MFS transporter [Pedosphaera sp.]|nr:MFS transporter [Pedosphaera sp.]